MCTWHPSGTHLKQLRDAGLGDPDQPQIEIEGAEAPPPPGVAAAARELLEEARALDARPALLAFIQASRELELERFDRAEAALQGGLELNPGSPTLLALQGEILLQRGQFAEARDVLIDARTSTLSGRHSTNVLPYVAPSKRTDVRISTSRSWRHLCHVPHGSTRQCLEIS